MAKGMPAAGCESIDDGYTTAAEWIGLK